MALSILASSLQYLCCNGLKGKIRLLSAMNEDEIMKRISVFKRPFNDRSFLEIEVENLRV